MTIYKKKAGEKAGALYSILGPSLLLLSAVILVLSVICTCSSKGHYQGDHIDETDRLRTSGLIAIVRSRKRSSQGRLSKEVYLMALQTSGYDRIGFFQINDLGAIASGMNEQRAPLREKSTRTLLRNQLVLSSLPWDLARTIEGNHAHPSPLELSLP